MKKDIAGQSLLEVLIALSVIILVLTALVRVVSLSIRSTDYARNASVAANSATEGMEILRSYRDSNTWDIFTGLTDGPMVLGLNPLISNYTSACPITVTIDNFPATGLLDNYYLRCSALTDGPVGVDGKPINVKAVISVYWLENDSVKKSEVTSYFYNWK